MTTTFDHPATHLTDVADLRVQLRADLRSIATDWPALLDAMYLPTRPPGAITDGDIALPGGTDRLDIAAATTHLLAYWAWATKDTHACPLARMDARDVPTVAAWLAEHTDYLLAHGAESADLTEQVADLATALRRLVAPTGVRRPPAGSCPHQDCPGTVRARLGHDEDTRDLVCDVDRTHSWDETRWRDLGRALGHIHDQAPERMRPEQLAAWLTERFGRPFTASTVRNWPARYPVSVQVDADGTYDRIAVTAWLIGRRATGNAA